ncbi:MAG: two pore domain potassium channel family protein [Nocardioidaceae bacterium]|nr:two pore domain potassium channel family protein [Nocardioidaceae bacterium]
MGRWWAFARRTPCLVLLVVQLAGVLLYPFMDTSYVGRAAFSLFGLLVLGLTVVALRATPALNWVAGLAAAPAAALLLVSVFTDNSDLFAWSAAFEMVAYFYASVSMLRYMLGDDEVTTDEQFAIPAVFTLLAWAFAYLFVVVQALDPGGFNPGGEGTRSWMELLFLSFTTLSSTGLSDITPISSHARSVVMLEQVAGLFYIAMVVTRLVSLRGDRVGRRTPP